MCNFKIVVIVVPGVQCFVQLIVGHRMKSSFIYPTGIIPMDHLAHEPELRLHFICRLTQGFHKIKIQYVRCIQTDPINIKLTDPEADHVTDIIFDCWISLIQLHQQIVAAPVIIGKSIVIFIISIEIHITVPVTVWRLLPVLLNILKCEKISSCMIEHTIKNHTNSLRMTFCHKCFQVFIGSQTAVQLLIVCRLITVTHGFTQRTDIQSCTSYVSDMFDPWDQRI